MKEEKKNRISSKMLIYIFSFICLILIVLTYYSSRFIAPIRQTLAYVVSPLQSGVNDMGLWTYNKSEQLKDAKKLMEENEKLTKEIADLSQRNKQLEQESYELARLRELLKLSEKYSDYDKVGARIIARENDNWFSRFTIDKGSAEGIKKDMNVIAGSGLVGIVISVDKHTSVVRSIIDDQSVVSAMVISNSEICTVSGNLKTYADGLLEVDNFKKDSKVEVGDAIVTSHISNKYLEGILVGYISDIALDSSELTQSGHLVSAVDFKNLQEVLVITKLKGVE